MVALTMEAPPRDDVYQDFIEQIVFQRIRFPSAACAQKPLALREGTATARMQKGFLKVH